MASNRNNRFRKQYFNISYADAKKLAGVRCSCLEEIEHEMNVPLSPKYMGNISLGLKEQLSNILFLFNNHLKGVPLAYNRIQVVKSSIIDDQEFLSLDIKVHFIVFKPRTSQILYGTVTKITDNKFGCVFHNCINGSVRRPSESHLTEEQRDIVNKINVGDEILLKIHKINSDNDILFVLGDLSPQFYRRMRRNSQCSVNGIDNGKNESTTRGGDSNNNTLATLKTTDSSVGALETDEHDVTSPKKKHKKRKCKHDEMASETTTTTEEEFTSHKLKEPKEISSPAKKKKKKKKHD